MISEKKNMEQRTQSWLEQLSGELDNSPERIETIPIEEVRAELADSGLDVKGFHSQLARTLALTKIQHFGAALIKWASPIWQPQWAGQAVSAGDVPAQAHVFPLPGGKGNVNINCAWRPGQGAKPAYMELSWSTNTVVEGELWCQFIQPGTQRVLKEVCLGVNNEGGKYFSAEALDFNPAREQWALSMLLKETASTEDDEA